MSDTEVAVEQDFVTLCGADERRLSVSLLAFSRHLQGELQRWFLPLATGLPTLHCLLRTELSESHIKNGALIRKSFIEDRVD